MSNITFNNVELHLQEHTQHGIISKLKTLLSRSPPMAEEKSKKLKRPGKPKTDIEVAEVWRVHETEGRTHAPWFEVPGAATQHPARTIIIYNW